MRYKLDLSYDGTNYHGWQVQKNTSNTVQHIVQENLNLILKESIEIIGCGRTDTGVSASHYIAHFDCKAVIEDIENVIYKLNQMFPDDVVIHDMQLVHPDFHARFDALSRSYRYRLTCTKQAFDRHYTYYYRFQKELDLTLLNHCANALIGKHDFTNFTKVGSDNKTNYCTITKSEWIVKDEIYTFTIQGDRFLRGMIRLLVGAMLNVNRGSLSGNEFISALINPNQKVQKWSVPPEGLLLTDIQYPVN